MHASVLRRTPQFWGVDIGLLSVVDKAAHLNEDEGVGVYTVD
jgi:hypothetical protein